MILSNDMKKDRFFQKNRPNVILADDPHNNQTGSEYKLFDVSG